MTKTAHATVTGKVQNICRLIQTLRNIGQGQRTLGFCCHIIICAQAC